MVEGDGRFESGALPPGTYQVHADADGYVRSSTATIDLQAGERRPMDLWVTEEAPDGRGRGRSG
jgi:hypothetical protein